MIHYNLPQTILGESSVDISGGMSEGSAREISLRILWRVSGVVDDENLGRISEGILENL